MGKKSLFFFDTVIIEFNFYLIKISDVFTINKYFCQKLNLYHSFPKTTLCESCSSKCSLKTLVRCFHEQSHLLCSI